MASEAKCAAVESNLSAATEAKQLYIDSMMKVCSGSHPTPDLFYEHRKCMIAAMKLFHSIKKMGEKEFSTKFAEYLDREIEKVFGIFKKQNDWKKVFTAATVLIAVLSVMVLIYPLLDGFCLKMLSILLTAYLGLIPCLYMICAGQRYIGLHEDTFSEFIWILGKRVLCSNYDKPKLGIKYCTTCKSWIDCAMCLENHRQITRLQTHTLTDRKDGDIPNLIRTIARSTDEDYRRAAYGEGLRNFLLNNQELSILSIDWFKAYCHFVMNPKSSSPGPVQHYIESEKRIENHYVTTKKVVMKLRDHFGSSQVLPVIKRGDYDPNKLLYLIQVIDIKSLPIDESQISNTAKIFYSDDHLPTGRVFKADGSELEEEQREKHVQDIVNDQNMALGDRLYVLAPNK